MPRNLNEVNVYVRILQHEMMMSLAANWNTGGVGRWRWICGRSLRLGDCYGMSDERSNEKKGDGEHAGQSTRRILSHTSDILSALAP
ncbi:MAG: hypothetical protein WCC21_06785 [Candidatus Acidiferrales bacterium]